MIKKHIICITMTAVAFAACQKELSQENPAGTLLSDVTFTALNETEEDLVRSSLHKGEDGVYSVHWSENDQVFISDGETYATYSATPDADDPDKAVLATGSDVTPAKDAQKYYAVYPADDAASADASGYTVVVPTKQVFNRDGVVIPRIGVAGADRNLKFRNVVSLLRIVPSNHCDSYDGVKVNKIEVISKDDNIAGPMTFTYDGENEPVLTSREAGSKKIVLECGGASFDETFYVAVAPGTYLSGLTVKIYSNGTGSQTYVIPGDKLYNRSRYATLKCNVTDLSIYQTANCYLVKRPGTYKFPVNVKGNGVVVEKCSISSAKLEVKDIKGYKVRAISQRGQVLADVQTNTAQSISNVQLADGFISFDIPEGYVPGNVLIGIYSSEDCAEGTCLWQWHIWINSDVADTKVGDHTILNMNLGSLQASTDDLSAYAGSDDGLYYQWGRKDPFHGLVNDSPEKKLNTLVKDLGYSVNIACSDVKQNRASLARGIEYPSTFYTGKEKKVDGTYERRAWFNGSNDVAALLWGGEIITDMKNLSNLAIRKTMFDPCPPGYHVPDAKVLSDVNEILPHDGYRFVPEDDTDERLTTYGKEGYYWSASAHSTGSMNSVVCKIVKDSETLSYEFASRTKSYAMSIRAQKQK